MNQLISAFKKIDKEMIEAKFGITVYGLFSYGSAVYRNKIPSDLDFIVITDDTLEQSMFVIDNVEIQIRFHTLKNFKELLNQQEISILECESLDVTVDDHTESYGYEPGNYDFKELYTPLIRNYRSVELHEIMMDHSIVLSEIRKSISTKSSNSYVKAKKKIIVSDDFDLKCSLKSLWHSFRMVDFGIQICKNKGIYNYKSMNELYNEITNDYIDFYTYDEPQEFWDAIHSKYRPRYNALVSDFKKLAPKNIKVLNDNVEPDKSVKITDVKLGFDPHDKMPF